MPKARGWKRRVGLETAKPNEIQPREPAPSAPARIEAGCEIEGNFSLEGSLIVEGDFRGAIRSGATVTVGQYGSVQADIEGREVIVTGAVVGDITARREIVLQATARVHGNLTAPSVVIERGAFYRGETRMYRPEHALREAASSDSTSVAAGN